MNRIGPAVALALVLVLAGCLGTPTADPAAAAAPAASSATTADAPDSTISVSATGAVEAAPDLAVVSVSVVARAESANAAREAAAADADRMVSVLHEFGLADDAVRTTAFAIYPVYDRDGDREEPVGYRAVHSYELRAAPEEAGSVVDTAVENGATRVGSVRFTLADDTRAELRTEAIRAAVENGRADAESVAAAAGVSVTELHSASTGSVGFVPYDARLAEGGGADAATSFEPGPVTVTASVSAVYRVSNGSSGS